MLLFSRGLRAVFTRQCVGDHFSFQLRLVMAPSPAAVKAQTPAAAEAEGRSGWWQSEWEQLAEFRLISGDELDKHGKFDNNQENSVYT